MKLRPGFTALQLLFAVSALTFVNACARGAGAGTGNSGGGGGGGGGGDTIDPPTGSQEPPFLAGLLALAADQSQLVCDLALPADGFEAALFVTTDSSNVFGAPPIQEVLTETRIAIQGLIPDQSYFVGLGVRAEGDVEWQPSGVVLETRSSAPIYVDAAADPNIADGLTPATAYNSLFLGLLVSIGQGGANIFVRDGDYPGASLPMLAGTHVYGGFQMDFDLATRDPFGGLTKLTGQTNTGAFDVQGGQPTAILDGILLDGAGAGTIGVDVTDTDLELRSVTIQNFTDRGVRIRNGSLNQVIDVRIAACRLSNNGADGLNGIGGMDLRVDGSSFDSNVQEGIELDDLVALDGDVGRLLVRGSRFLGNGTEGLDVDLAAPFGLGSQGGFFDVDVEGCLFEGNAGAGFLLDQDYELIQLWDGDFNVRGCTARGNGAEGILFDADAPASARFHRCLVVGNALDGLWIRSETDAGTILVSSLISLGNGGFGLHASLGNKVVAATHVLLAGNQAGGFVSETVESSIVSSVAYLQTNPWQNVRRSGSAEVDDAFDGSFNFAPEGFARITAQSADMVTLDDISVAIPGLPVEVADDGTARQVLSVAGNVATLDSAPDTVRLPALLLRFGPGTSATEDWRLPSNSPLLGLGFRIPGGSAVDPGPFGAPLPGPPGLEDEVQATLFTPLTTAPALTDPLASMQPLVVTFPSPLDPASLVPGAVRAVDANGSELAVGVMLLGNDLTITPPPTGWGSSAVSLELHRELFSMNGDPLATPLLLPLNN